MENMGRDLARRAGSPVFVLGDVLADVPFVEAQYETYRVKVEPGVAKAPVASPFHGFVPGMPLRLEGGK